MLLHARAAIVSRACFSLPFATIIVPAFCYISNCREDVSRLRAGGREIGSRAAGDVFNQNDIAVCCSCWTTIVRTVFALLPHSSALSTLSCRTGCITDEERRLFSFSIFKFGVGYCRISLDAQGRGLSLRLNLQAKASPELVGDFGKPSTDRRIVPGIPALSSRQSPGDPVLWAFPCQLQIHV